MYCLVLSQVMKVLEIIHFQCNVLSDLFNAYGKSLHIETNWGFLLKIAFILVATKSYKNK